MPKPKARTIDVTATIDASFTLKLYPHMNGFELSDEEIADGVASGYLDDIWQALMVLKDAAPTSNFSLEVDAQAVSA